MSYGKANFEFSGTMRGALARPKNIVHSHNLSSIVLEAEYHNYQSRNQWVLFICKKNLVGPVALFHIIFVRFQGTSLLEVRDAMADEELKKAFQDLQFKTNETRALIAQGEVAKKLNTQKQRMSELSAASISEVPNDHAVYRSVGRMFLLTTKDAEIERHNKEALEYK
ncbi:hypothetical protein ANCCAN_20418 [Ancylostoma caninum]|uniref:Prefoldin subunit n=1 Tax=Ancylostoma caninum TaxID=29170 RepID=A0A368FSF6_ANCCA|nr:hypothetical protein ANCCAN_20418 [Ancylostoma caninum]